MTPPVPRVCSKCDRPLPSIPTAARIFPGCGHAYHFSCIDANQERCPHCRAVSIGLTVAGAVTGALLAPVVAPAALGIIGFGAAGPVAGGIAAGIQSLIGNVAAGSLFAMCQSVAMGGALPAIGYAAGAAAGAAAGGAMATLEDGGNSGDGGAAGADAVEPKGE